MRLSTWLESLKVDIFKAEIYVHAFSTSFAFFELDKEESAKLLHSNGNNSSQSCKFVDIVVCMFVSFAILHKSRQSFLDCVYFLLWS